MHSVTNDSFGPLVAYLVPGAIALLGLSFYVPAIQLWFATTPNDAPTIGGFLYLTVASLAVGMTVSAVRWVLVDTLHTWTGLRSPPLDFSKLGPNVEAMELLIGIHYRHYLCYANASVATAITYTLYRTSHGFSFHPVTLDLAFIVLEAILIATGRDTLKRYYVRSAQLLKGKNT